MLTTVYARNRACKIDFGTKIALVPSSGKVGRPSNLNYRLLNLSASCMIIQSKSLPPNSKIRECDRMMTAESLMTGSRAQKLYTQVHKQAPLPGPLGFGLS